MNNRNEQPADLNSEEEDLENESKSPIEDIDEIKDWREGDLTDEQKIEEIKKRKIKIDEGADEFGFDMEKSIEDVRNELKERYEKYAEMKGDLSRVHSGNIEDGATEGLDEMKDILSSLSGIYENQLQIEYLEYLEKYKEDLKDPDLLLKSHAERNLIMNNWETIIENMRADLKKTETDEGEVLRGWAQWVKNHPEITLVALAALVAAGVAVGVLLTPEIIATLPATGLPEVALPAVKEGVAVAAKMFAGAGALAGAGKIIAWLSNEENRDKLVKGIFQADFPPIYYALGGKRAGEKK